jgi:PAS domain S-box-containing protein
MGGKPTYEELERKINGLEREIDRCKQSEERLRIERGNLKNVFEAMADGVYIVDQHYDIQYVNSVLKKDFGSYAGRKCYEYFHNRKEVCPWCKNSEVFAGKTVRWEFYVSKNRRTYDLIDTPLQNLDGSILKLEIFRDITERKQMEEALRESEKRFRQILEDVSNIAVQGYDEERRVTFWNKASEKLYGYTEEEALGDKLEDLIIPPNMREQVQRFVQRWIEFGEKIPAGENNLVGKNGKDVPVFSSHAMIETANGKEMFCLDVDLASIKKAEKALRQREQYLQGLNDAAQALLASTAAVPFQGFVDNIGPVAGASRVYVFLNYCGPDGRLLTSPKAEWCAEGVTSEIKNPKLHDFPYDIWGSRWIESLSHGELISGKVTDFPVEERRFLEPLGTLAILLIPIMVDDEFIGFIGFDNCVSECEWDVVARTFLCVAAGDLAQAIKRARLEARTRASLKEKEVLLREIHHRVKNNMQVIVSLLRMHARQVDDGDTRLGQVFDDCRDRVNAMSLIHEALYQSDDLARIDFEDYLKKLCRNLSRAYNASGQGIVVKVERCNVALGMDQGLAVGMVISELVANAFKHAFSPGSGGIVTVSLSGIAGEEVELIVEDNGKGLPPEIDIQKLSSLGLRLAVAAITRELGGSIEVERNGGTRFIIHFKCTS